MVGVDVSLGSAGLGGSTAGCGGVERTDCEVTAGGVTVFIGGGEDFLCALTIMPGILAECDCASEMDILDGMPGTIPKGSPCMLGIPPLLLPFRLRLLELVPVWELPLGTGDPSYTPCLLAMCVLRKYLLQNSRSQRSQYASWWKMREDFDPLLFGLELSRSEFRLSLLLCLGGGGVEY